MVVVEAVAVSAVVVVTVVLVDLVIVAVGILGFVVASGVALTGRPRPLLLFRVVIGVVENPAMILVTVVVWSGFWVSAL